MRVNERVLSSVVFLGLEDRGGFTPLGTAFFAAAGDGGRLFQHVITARHVVERLQRPEIVVRMNTRDGRVEHHHLDMASVVYHPDPAVDVAVFPTHVPPERFNILHVRPDNEALTQDVIRDYWIGVGDEVFMAGMFTSHIGEAQNRPIVRVGSIAAMADEKVQTTRGLHPGYLIEARSIAGLSGSPVFVHLPPWRSDADGVVKPMSGHKWWYFMGLMQGHYLTADASETTSPDTEYAPGDMSTGIGVVVPVEQILEAIAVPELADQRRDVLEKQARESGFSEDSAAGSGSPTTADNPDHREDFNRLLGAAVSGPKRGSGK